MQTVASGASEPGVTVTSLPVMGWKEQVSLPDWEVPRLRAKLDTGARTSAIHAEDVTVVDDTGNHDPRTGEPLPRVRFWILVGSRQDPRRVAVEAEVSEFRSVRDTSADAERRPVVRTRIRCGPLDVPDAEITLTARHGMNFRMLLGRLTLQGRCLVDPAGGYLHTPAPASR